jgi:hypothetical protein
MEFTASELIEISMINCLPKNMQDSMLKGLLSQCDSRYSGNPNYSRNELTALPTATAIFIAKLLLEQDDQPRNF